MITVKNIMVAVDFSQAAVFAARYAAALAQDQQARLYVLHVKAPFPVHGRIAGGAMEHVQRQRNYMEHNALSGLIPDSVKNSIAVEYIQVTGLLKRLADRKITVQLTDAAKGALVTEGYDPAFGARPLKRTLQRRILDPLALKILDGEVREGDHVLVEADGDRVTFKATRPAAASA